MDGIKMNNIVYLMCKYAGVPAGVLKTVSSFAGRGSTLRRVLSKYIMEGADKATRQIRTRLFRGDVFKGPETLASAAFHPKYEPALLEKDLARYLQRRWTPERAQQVAQNYVMTKKLPDAETAMRYYRTQRNPSAALNQYRNNAQGADAVKYFFTQNARTPGQSAYIRNIPVLQDGSPSYSGFGYKVRAGDPGNVNAFHTIGHELGHARYYTKRVPTIAAHKGDTNFVANGVSKMHTSRLRNATGGQPGDALQFWHEVGANQQYYKVMQRALADNPQLYERWRTSMEMSNLPNLATYLYYSDPRMPLSILSLPKSLQPQAKAYFSRYADMVRRSRNYARKHQISRDDAFERMIDVYRRAAQRNDPTLGRDLYQYAVSRGMPVNTRAWYNQPEYRAPGSFMPPTNAVAPGVPNQEFDDIARQAINSYW